MAYGGQRPARAVAEEAEDDLVGRDPKTETQLLRQAGVRRVKGRLVRTCTTFQGRGTDPATGKEALIQAEVERPVALDLETAKATGADYWDPELKWFRGGRKREQEYPENTGRADDVRRVRYVPVEAADPRGPGAAPVTPVESEAPRPAVQEEY